MGKAFQSMDPQKSTNALRLRTARSDQEGRGTLRVEGRGILREEEGKVSKDGSAEEYQLTALEDGSA